MKKYRYSTYPMSFLIPLRLKFCRSSNKQSQGQFRQCSLTACFIVLLVLLYVWYNLYVPPNVSGHIVVVHARTGKPFDKHPYAGMFSEFASVIGALVYAEGHGAAGVAVEFTTPMYGKNGENWWANYFNPLMLFPGSSAEAPRLHFDRYIARYGRWGSWAHHIYGTKSSHFPYSSAIPRSQYSDVVARYIQVQRDLAQEVQSFVQPYSGDELVLALHYRGTDTAQHYPFVAVPYETVLAEAVSVVESAGHNVSTTVFVATDETAFLLAVRRHPVLGRKVKFYPIRRSNAGEDALHKDVRFAPGFRAHSVVRDMLTLAAAHHIVKTRSCVSDASIMLNPRASYSFVVAAGEVYRVKGEQGGIPPGKLGDHLTFLSSRRTFVPTPS